MEVFAYYRTLYIDRVRLNYQTLKTIWNLYKNVSCNFTKSLENKTTLNIVNASYLFTQFSTLARIYTITAREPSIYATAIGHPPTFQLKEQCVLPGFQSLLNIFFMWVILVDRFFYDHLRSIFLVSIIDFYIGAPWSGGLIHQV